MGKVIAKMHLEGLAIQLVRPEYALIQGLNELMRKSSQLFLTYKCREVRFSSDKATCCGCGWQPMMLEDRIQVAEQ